MKHIVMTLLVLALTSCAATTVPPKNRCQQVWNEVWIPAKKGDLKARFKLAGMLIFHDFTPPGGGRDRESRQKLYMAFETHALGYSDGSAFSKQVPAILARMYGEARNPETEDFFACLEQAPSQQCTKIGVEKKIVPPFELLAREIDAATMLGEEPRCPAPPQKPRAPTRRK